MTRSTMLLFTASLPLQRDTFLSTKHNGTTSLRRRNRTRFTLTPKMALVHWDSDVTSEGRAITRVKDGKIDIPAELYAYGQRVILVDQRHIPIPARKLWTCFDDYLQFQEALNFHEDTILEPGPVNGPGATISFKYLGGRTYETLLVKDDEQMIWKIELPRPNEVFSFYEATISCREREKGAEAYAMVDGIFIDKEDEKRHGYLENVKRVWPTRVRELVEYIVDRDGTEIKMNFKIENSLENMWKVIGDWGNVDWVMNATFVVVHDETQPARTVTFADGNTLYQYMKLRDEREKKLVYVIESSKKPLPFFVYRGEVTLKPDKENENHVKIEYVIKFVPVEEGKGHTVADALRKDFQSRFAWLQAKFAAPGPAKIL